MDGSMLFARWRQCAPHLYILPWTHLNPQPKRHLDRFSRFFTVADRQTDGQTDWPTEKQRPVYSRRLHWIRRSLRRRVLFLFSGRQLSFWASADLRCCLLAINETDTQPSDKYTDANTLKRQFTKNRHFGTIAQLCRTVYSQVRRLSTIGKKLVKQQCLFHMSS